MDPRLIEDAIATTASSLVSPVLLYDSPNRGRVAVYRGGSRHAFNMCPSSRIKSRINYGQFWEQFTVGLPGVLLGW